MSEPERELTYVEEQILAMIKENKNKYPEATDWLLEIIKQYDTSVLITKEEHAWKILQGSDTLSPLNRIPSEMLNSRVAMIKWYRNETGAGLIESKKIIDNFVDYGNPKRFKVY